MALHLETALQRKLNFKMTTVRPQGQAPNAFYAIYRYIFFNQEFVADVAVAVNTILYIYGTLNIHARQSAYESAQSSNHLLRNGVGITLTTWPRPSDKFNKDLLKQTKMYNMDTLENMYGHWDSYVKYVNDGKMYKSSPEQSDACSAHLLSNHVPNLRTQSPPPCVIPDFCKDVVDKGSEYGYGLLHRLLLMVVARFSRECIMFSKTKDKFKTDTFCMLAFYEAEYISYYNFVLPDLMFEQMALCGLFGHAQFLRNYWLKSLLQFQTKEGCFSSNFVFGNFDENLLRQGQDDKWKMNSPLTIMGGQCQGHFTAVAATSISHALRYILETYY